MSNKKKLIIYLIIILLITVVLFVKLFKGPRLYGHDTVFHASNIIALSKTISLKQPTGANIIKTSVERYGYGTWLFYPKLPHILGAYLYLITKNIYTSMNIIYFITTFLSGVACFFLTKKLFKNDIVSLLATVIYLTFPYHITEIYIRDALSENFMFLVIPLIFLGLSYLKDDNYKLFYILFTLGYIIGMYTHLICMIFVTFFVAFYLIYHHEKFLKMTKIEALITSTIIVTCISLPYLVTVNEHKALNLYTLYLSDTFTNRKMVVTEALKLKQLYNGASMKDKIKPYIDILVIIMFCISLITNYIYRKKQENKKELNCILIIIVALITMIYSKFIWQIVPDILLMIQFPWRLLTLLSLFVSIYAVSFLANIITTAKKATKNIIKVSSIVIAIILIITNVNKIEFFGKLECTEEIITNDLGLLGWQQEYLPYDQIIDYVLIEDEKYDLYFNHNKYGVVSKTPDVEIKIEEDNFPNMKINVKNIKNKTEIELPRTYYLGYELRDKNNNIVELYSDEHGMLGAKINEDGLYSLKYTKTTQEKIALIIRSITIIIIIIYICKRAYEKRKKAKVNTMLQRKKYNGKNNNRKKII